jgi:peptidyl-lysine (3S)-dioxygenase / protease
MEPVSKTDRIDKAIEDLIRDYQELNPNEIDELSEEPTPLEFMRYVAKNRPFVIRRGAVDWPAYKKWDADYLIQRMGHSPVKVAVTPSGFV